MEGTVTQKTNELFRVGFFFFFFPPQSEMLIDLARVQLKEGKDECRALKGVIGVSADVKLGLGRGRGRTLGSVGAQPGSAARGLEELGGVRCVLTLWGGFDPSLASHPSL